MIRYWLFIFGIVLSIKGNSQLLLTRGPYLQQATHSSVIIRWRTSIATSSQVRIRSASAKRAVTKMDLTTNHEIIIDSLDSDTRYNYSIGTADSVIQTGPDNHFTTYPDEDISRKLRFWITGDCGNKSANQRRVRDQYLNYVNGAGTDGWLLLGDNAYINGTDLEYQTNFFEVYQESIMKNTCLWPAPGNHEYANNATLQLSRDIPYYSIFTVPKGGEAGGVASGSESYYSYDVGNIHFISLDSYGMENGLRLSDTLSQQVEWLKKDLASNEKMWTVAYFHHPPYTKGSHDSDTENELVRIRQYTVGILERFNVDLVLSGHSHSYERTRLISNHFGLSGTFDQLLHEIDSSSARYDGTVNSCPYIKNESNRGTVYVVAGSAGQVGGNIASYPHKAMYYSNRTVGGSGILEIESNRLDFKWLSGAGVIEDSFTILKTVGVNTERTVNAGDPITLAASWVGTYQWENDPELSSPALSPIISRDSLFVVRDEHNCVADSTRIRIGITTEVPGIEPFISIYPNPANESFSIDTGSPVFHRMDLFDAQGRLVMQRKLELQNTFECHGLARGVYVVMLIGQDRVMRRKILLR